MRDSKRRRTWPTHRPTHKVATHGKQVRRRTTRWTEQRFNGPSDETPSKEPVVNRNTVTADLTRSIERMNWRGKLISIPLDADQVARQCQALPMPRQPFFRQFAKHLCVSPKRLMRRSWLTSTTLVGNEQPRKLREFRQSLRNGMS